MASEVCGSWRAVRYVGGYVIEEVWCPRIDGPCPFPGTVEGPKGPSSRPCADPPEVPDA